MSNPLIATSDVILDFLDIRLRHRKLQSDIIKEELNNAGLSGNEHYIGIPHLHTITPISDCLIDKEPFRARPVYFLLFEDRPSEFAKDEWIETKLQSGMSYFAIKEAFENNGCVKLYDKTRDHKFLSHKDCFIWCGDKGKEIVDAVGKANGTKDLFYHGQSGI